MALAKVKDDLSHYLRLAEGQEIVITRHGRPAGVLIGFQSEEDWFEYQLESNPEFLRRIAAARARSGKAGRAARGLGAFERRANNEMKPTKRRPGRASRLISVLCVPRA